MIISFNKEEFVIQFYYNFRWSILYGIYIRGLVNLFLIYELYYLALLDCGLILKFVVSPADESSLLLKLCVECLTLSDDGNIYAIVKELHGKSVLAVERYFLSPSSTYENTKAGVPPSQRYTPMSTRPQILTSHNTILAADLQVHIRAVLQMLISRTLRFITTRCSPLYEILCDVFYGLNILLDGTELQDGFLHFGAEQSPCFTVSATFTVMLIQQT